ncbi:hypothetical protein GIX45_28565 [Erwinia sp. CPCC 100877]|nr:hypothetical protein [Erwinia sp. CPCC 100877]
MRDLDMAEINVVGGAGAIRDGLETVGKTVGSAVGAVIGRGVRSLTGSLSPRLGI